MFFEVLRDTDELQQAALAKYRYFVGALWERFGEPAWMGPWREVHVRKVTDRSGVVATRRAIEDRGARQSVPMILDNLEGADVARAALGAAFDDPAVSELRVFNTGDGEAMSGLLIAPRRAAGGETTYVVFLMD